MYVALLGMKIASLGVSCRADESSHWSWLSLFCSSLSEGKELPKCPSGVCTKNSLWRLVHPASGWSFESRRLSHFTLKQKRQESRVKSWNLSQLKPLYHAWVCHVFSDTPSHNSIGTWAHLKKQCINHFGSISTEFEHGTKMHLFVHVTYYSETLYNIV